MVTSMTLIAVVCFILGFVCNCFGKTCKEICLKARVRQISVDDRQFTGETSHSKFQVAQDLEMTSNVAYGSVKLKL